MGQASEHLAAHFEPNSDVLFVHFSSRNKPSGKFHKFPVPSGCSNIYINPADLNWYLDGLPCWGSLDKTIENLGALIDESGARTVVFVGSSMGAWGAAYYAQFLPATKAILFGPELVLNCFGGYSESNLRGRDSVPQAKPSARCDYTLVAGSHSPSDIACSIEFLGGDGQGLYVIQGMGHATSAELQRLGLLSRVLEEVSSFEGKSSVLQALQHPDLHEIVSTFAGTKYNLEVLKAYVSSIQDPAKLDRMLKELTHDMGVKKLVHQALDLLTSAGQRIRLSDQLMLSLIRFARKAKRDALALELIDTLSDKPALERDVLWEKALLLERQGRAADAKEAFTKVCAAHLKDPIFIIAHEKSCPGSITPSVTHYQSGTAHTS